MANPRQRALKLALQILGSEIAACDTLRARAAELRSWVSEEATPPVEVLMRALDVILEDPALAARYAVKLAAKDEEQLTGVQPS